MYQNGYLQHVFNGGALAGSTVSATTAATEMMCEMSVNNTNAIASTIPTTAAAAAAATTNNGHNQNVDVNGKTVTTPAPNTNTLSSSKSSSSNQSMDVFNVLPNYQPRWHHQLMNSTFALRNPLHPSLIKAHLESVNHEIAQLDSRIESILLKQHQAMNQSQALAEINAATIYRNPVDTMIGNGAGDSGTAMGQHQSANDTTVISASMPTSMAQMDNKFSNMNISNGCSAAVAVGAPHSLNAKSMPATITAAAHNRYPLGATQQIDSETEHIYETIPEDSESEPIYCSPYRGETDSESNLVHEWLNLKDEQLQQYQQHQQQQRRCIDGGSSKTNWTRSTKSNSSVEDHENSSSAYNTGGSCNSNHQLTLELSDTNLDDGNKTLVFCPTKHLQPKFPTTIQQQQQQQHESKSTSVRQSMPSSGGNKKEKVLSPTHNNRRSECNNEQNVTRKSNSNHQGNVFIVQETCFYWSINFFMLF